MLSVIQALLDVKELHLRSLDDLLWSVHVFEWLLKEI